MLLNFHGMDRPIHGMLLQIEGLFFAENEPFSNVFGPFCRISASWRGSAGRALRPKERGRGGADGKKPKKNEGKRRRNAKKT